KTIENYKQAKLNIFANQTKHDYLIYNAENKILKKEVQHAHSTLIPFSKKKKYINGVWTDEESIYFKNEKIIDKSEIVLVGDHNLENILAAIGAAKLCGATNEGIKKVLTSFSGVKHR